MNPLNTKTGKVATITALGMLLMKWVPIIFGGGQITIDLWQETLAVVGSLLTVLFLRKGLVKEKP